LKIIRLINTVRHLRLIQLYYQVYYRVKSRLVPYNEVKRKCPVEIGIVWDHDVYNPQSYLIDNTFVFINLEKKYEGEIDWNFSDYGKLWTYNLTYFDYLNQNKIEVGIGIELIKDYINNDNKIIEGKDPYPISLRGINWIKFLSKNKINEGQINSYLYNDYLRLYNNVEYHLMANHLLENGFSLLFGAYYFKDIKLYRKAYRILEKELEEQILNDGAHFELSPMYHQIILFRLLDCIKLVRNNNQFKETPLLLLLSKAKRMLSWLDRITYSNGNIPMFNDSTYGIAPQSVELFEYAKKLNIKWEEIDKLSDSGYRKWNYQNMELVMDIGDIMPSYQPAHNHSDTFNFEFHYENSPVIVDKGISTYNKNQLRQKERSTNSHNTVQLGSFNQTDVWGGFRVGKRARIIKLIEENNSIIAQHDGYKMNGVIHQRQFELNQTGFVISDLIIGKSSLVTKKYLHLHPTIKHVKIKNNEVILNGKFKIIFQGNLIKINQGQYDFCLGFNMLEKAIVISTEFDKNLVTTLQILKPKG